MAFTREQIRDSIERAGDADWQALIRHHEDAYPESRPTPGDVARAEAERLNDLGLGDNPDLELVESRVERVDSAVRITHVFEDRAKGIGSRPSRSPATSERDLVRAAAGTTNTGTRARSMRRWRDCRAARCGVANATSSDDDDRVARLGHVEQVAPRHPPGLGSAAARLRPRRRRRDDRIIENLAGAVSISRSASTSLDRPRGEAGRGGGDAAPARRRIETRTRTCGLESSGATRSLRRVGGAVVAETTICQHAGAGRIVDSAVEGARPASRRPRRGMDSTNTSS